MSGDRRNGRLKALLVALLGLLSLRVVVAIVASAGGDLRMLWSRLHYQGTLVSACPMGPMSCNWSVERDSSIAWLATAVASASGVAVVVGSELE